jgi:hypothetical protein
VVAGGGVEGRKEARAKDIEEEKVVLGLPLETSGNSAEKKTSEK